MLKHKVALFLLLLIPIVYLFILFNLLNSTQDKTDLNWGVISNTEVAGLSPTFTTPPQKRFDFKSFYFPPKTYNVPILMYHYVEYNTNKEHFKRDQLNIEPNVFESQIVTLKNAGYKFITTSELTEMIINNKKQTDKYVILTFDDGYRDFYTDAYPIIKKHDVKAVVYIIYNFINQENYMFDYQIKEIASDPLIEIGSHTLNHRYLKGLDEETVKSELTKSKLLIENDYKVKVNSFAYPYGVYDDFAVSIVEETGYTNAVITELGLIHTKNDLRLLKRVRPGYNTGEVLIEFLNNLSL